MDKKKVFKDVLDACKSAEFHKAFNLVKDLYKEVDNKCAVNIIVCCCNACVDNASRPENVDEDDLFILLEYVTSNLMELKEADLLSYLQSIFFIVKLLAKKECYGIIVKMEGILLPTFLPLSLPDKHRDTYQSCASLLYNLVAKAVAESYIKYKELLLKISYIVSKIFMKVGNVGASLNMSYNCAINLCKLEVCLEDRVQYFFHVLSLLEAGHMKVNSDEQFKSFVSYFAMILNNILKKFDFEMAADFYEKTVRVGVHILDDVEHVNVLTLLKYPLVLSPCSRKQFHLDGLTECKKSLRKLQNASIKQYVGSKLHGIIYTIVFLYYKAVCREGWCEFPEDFQLEILQFICLVSQLETQAKFSCPCKCLIKGNVYQKFAYVQYITTLLELSVTQSTLAHDTHQKAVQLLVNFYDDVRVLKESGCEKWKSAWNTVGMALYNLGVHLYQKGEAVCLRYFYTLIKHFIEFEARTASLVLKFSIVSSAFSTICSVNLQSRDYEKCLAFAALGILLCPKQRDNLITHWIKAKANQRDLKTLESEEMQRITLVSAFKRFETEIASVAGNVNLLPSTDKVDLLTFELEQYKKMWKSKVPMMSSLKELCNTANINTTVKVIVNVFGECEMNLHSDVPKILSSVLKQYETKVCGLGNENPESNIHLGVLYFLQYKYCVTDAITKNADDMERSMMLAPKAAGARDPNEECDIVSSYESLKLDKYISVMKNLNKSITLFSSAFPDLEPTTLGLTTASLLYDLLLKISFEYRLHCHKVRSLQALQMALKLAQAENDPRRLVQSIGYIIEQADISKSYVKYLILIADKQIDSIECSNLRNLKIILTYYICKSKAYLYHDYKEAYRIFHIASELYEVQEDKSELDLIKCQLLVLHYKFVMMPCSFEVVDHKKSTLLTIHSACNTVFEIYNKSKIGGSYEMSVLLDTNSEIAKLYHNLRCPREVRAYCRETIILAQKLVLPLQCASYLVYLAHADLRSTRYDDCLVKLDGLADILCLPKQKPQTEQEPEVPVYKDFVKEMEGVTNDMREMMLDLPTPSSYKRQFSPSSPVLVIESFHLPGFARHDTSCDCFYCVCLEYQGLVLEKTRLDALYSVKQSNPSVARDFFHGCLDLYECCVRRNESYVEIASKFVSYDLIPECEAELLEAYGSVLLNYSYQLMRNRNKAEALRTTNKLINLLLPRKVELVYLYNEVLMQKLGYIADVPSIAADVREPDVESIHAQRVELATTPESKHSKVAVPVAYSPFITPPKRIPKKCLKFNLSPIEHNSADQELKNASPHVLKAPKTPGPKIKIYSNGDFVVQAKTPAPKLQISTDTKKSNRKKRQNENHLFLAPPSPERIATPFPPKTDSVLKERTKLLTEKLRQSSKKAEGTALDSVNGNLDENVVQNGRRKPSARKNLLSELGNEQSAGQGGAIRRSTRQRKI